MGKASLFTHDQAKRYYNWMGAGLDSQSFYEEPALRDLARHLSLENCKAVLEFGCGTGRFAQELLQSRLPQDAAYLGIDVSNVMVELSRNRLSRFCGRAEVLQSDGAMRISRLDASFDCVICTYVLDLLSRDDIHRFVEEARRLLKPGGQLGVVSLTNGPTRLSHLLTAVWSGLHGISPWIVGGCRPIVVSSFLPPPDWQIAYRNTVTAYGVPSEIVVARKPA